MELAQENFLLDRVNNGRHFNIVLEAGKRTERFRGGPIEDDTKRLKEISSFIKATGVKYNFFEKS